MNNASKIMSTKIDGGESLRNSKKRTITTSFKSAAKWLRKNRSKYEN